MKFGHLILGFALAAGLNACGQAPQSNSAPQSVNAVQDIGAFNNGYVTLYYTAGGQAYRAECLLSGVIQTGTNLRDQCKVPHELKNVPEADFYTALQAKYLARVGRTELNFDDKTALDTIKARLPGQGMDQKPYMFPVNLSSPANDLPSKTIQIMVAQFDAAFGVVEQGLLLGHYVTEIQRGDSYLTLTLQGELNISKLQTVLAATEANATCGQKVVEVLHSNKKRPTANDFERLTTTDGMLWSVAQGQNITKGFLWIRLRSEQDRSKCLVTLRDVSSVQ